LVCFCSRWCLLCGDQEKDKEIAKLRSQVELFRSQLVDFKLSLKNTEQERDFAFNKLKEVEFYVEDMQNTEAVSAEQVLQHIHKLLYGDSL
jgi:hypothetical protein